MANNSLDLSQTIARIKQSESKLHRRSGFTSHRRGPEAPRTERPADMRQARRGDSGASDLMRALNMTQSAAGDFQNYAAQRHDQQEHANAAQGAADAVVGIVDEEKEAKSRAYGEALSEGRIRREWFDGLADYQRGLAEIIENQTQPTVAEREKEVRDYTEGYYRSFAIDPETGELREDMSPSAKLWLANEMGSTRVRNVTAALQAVEEKINAEGEMNFVGILTGQTRDGRPLDLTEALSAVPPTVPRERLRKIVFQVVSNEANRRLQTGDPVGGQRLWDQLADIVGDGVAATAMARPGTAGSPAPSEGPSGTVTATGVAGQYARAFRQHGLSEPVIAGILGNVHYESAFRSGRVGDNGTAFGHFQWRASRVDNFLKVIGTHPKDATVEQQAHFVKWELDNPTQAGMSAKNRDRILNAKTPEEAARAFDQFYERSDGKTRDGRAAMAAKFFKGSEGGPGGVTPRPDYAMGDKPLDPVEAAKADPGNRQVGKLEGIWALRPEEVAAVYEGRAAYANKARVEFNRQQEEAQDEVYGSYLMRVYEQGEPLSETEIVQASADRTISPQRAASLLNLQQSRRDEAIRREDRNVAQYERMQAKADEDEALSVTAGFYRELTTGTSTPGQIMDRLMTYATTEANGQVRDHVIGAVMRDIGRVEQLRKGSDETRAATELLSSAVEAMVQQVPLRGSRGAKAHAGLKKEIGTVEAKMLRKIIDGVPAAKARAEAVEEARPIFARWRRINQPPVIQ
ncbi:MAG TPA: phage tail tip lysozyme [Sphingobium sp.]|nr:phage tail tip lysozyme [Sphingobium sp.]